ncbi:unnamed protein product [Rhizophagus irregularis]|nr:unnamed protein product [Rhizophagus irregularis]CAB5194019.1 unnamed protein product [Rhizophagus irregularis]
MDIQPIQGYQSTQSSFFYQPPNDDNFYHITIQNYLWENNYDYGFYYQGYHFACKLLLHTLIVNMLNKEIYGREFDANDLKRKNTLTWDQKLKLELHLRQDLPFLQDQILNSNPNMVNMNSSEVQSKQKDSQLNDGIKLFYQAPNDNRFYHITCKILLQDYIYDYDYEFFYKQKYHVTCKSLSHTLIINILNKEIYGRDFDVNDLRRNYALTTSQKLNLELNLKQVLPSYLYIPEREMRSDSNENTQHESDVSQAGPTVDIYDGTI